ncbi:hypothetical protein E2C01_059397 [Portunus trituberculatus]|uniref:Uncharacterized protein n=1 Tax=Portunus trituberculatus TaxID=210409 RepID=A0A5B7H8Y5_PORTR|nr:hypothetical protein [Portunus trituberculatus]
MHLTHIHTHYLKFKIQIGIPFWVGGPEMSPGRSALLTSLNVVIPPSTLFH